MAENTQSFSIMLVNYKTKQLTSLCLDLLKKHIDPEKVDVVVVDNGSADESLDYLRALDWITLVEREQAEGEPAFISHGEALDAGIGFVKNRYVCLMHTDTFIHDPQVFNLLLNKIREPGVAAVGSLDQRHRAAHRKLFRHSKKALSYYSTKIRVLLGQSNVTPKPYRDTYLKSFCCMWDAHLIKKEQLNFTAAGKNPGYFMQDELIKKGFRFVSLQTSLLFRFLDHVQSGTVVELKKLDRNQRRGREYDKVLQQISSAS